MDANLRQIMQNSKFLAHKFHKFTILMRAIFFCDSHTAVITVAFRLGSDVVLHRQYRSLA